MADINNPNIPQAPVPPVAKKPAAIQAPQGLAALVPVAPPVVVPVVQAGHFGVGNMAPFIGTLPKAVGTPPANPVNLTIADLNGSIFMGSLEGERRVNDALNVTYVPENTPVAAIEFAHVTWTDAQLLAFIQVNVAKLRQADNTISIQRATNVAFLRALVITFGLASPDFDHVPHNCTYNGAVRITNHDIATLYGLNHVNRPLEADLLAAMPPAARTLLRATFADRVCLVAFVFRARGHHYLPTFEELYNRVWGKCRYEPEQAITSWQELAVWSLHSIYPDTLDRFWQYCKDNALCNGALIKRFDVAAAGTAGPMVLHQGLLDLTMIAPGFRWRVPEQMIYLNDCVNRISANRWDGSVNAGFYGARRVTFDEKKLGAIAATIKAAIDGLTPQAMLGKSPALQRIATNAPITGAVLGRAIGQLAQRSEVVDALLVP